MAKHLLSLILGIILLTKELCVIAAPEIVSVDSSSKSVPNFLMKECISRFSNLAPDVHVTINNTPVVEDYSKSIADLTALSANTRPNQNNLGLTTFEYGLSTESGLTLITDPATGVSCGIPSVKATLNMKSHRVYIASEFLTNYCLFNYVRKHEYTHVAINNRELYSTANYLKSDLTSYFKNKIFVGHRDTMTSKFNSSISSFWAPTTIEQMQANVKPMHRLIDTPAEYAKVNRACGGAVLQYINHP